MSAGPDSARSDSAPASSAPESRPRRRFVVAVTLLFASINAIGLYFIVRAVSERSPDVFGVEFVSARADVGKARELVLRFDRPIVTDAETIAGVKPSVGAGDKSKTGDAKSGVSGDASPARSRRVRSSAAGRAGS